MLTPGAESARAQPETECLQKFCSQGASLSYPGPSAEFQARQETYTPGSRWAIPAAFHILYHKADLPRKGRSGGDEPRGGLGLDQAAYGHRDAMGQSGYFLQRSPIYGTPSKHQTMLGTLCIVQFSVQHKKYVFLSPSFNEETEAQECSRDLPESHR